MQIDLVIQQINGMDMIRLFFTTVHQYLSISQLISVFRWDFFASSETGKHTKATSKRKLRITF